MFSALTWEYLCYNYLTFCKSSKALILTLKWRLSDTNCLLFLFYWKVEFFVIIRSSVWYFKGTIQGDFFFSFVIRTIAPGLNSLKAISKLSNIVLYAVYEFCPSCPLLAFHPRLSCPTAVLSFCHAIAFFSQLFWL
jgi:hypothetical protein